MYVLITHDKTRLLLTQDQAKQVFEAIQAGEKYIIIQSQMIPLHIIPTVLEVEVWYTQENEKLRISNRRLCKKCLSIMDILDVCDCWEKKSKGYKKNSFRQPVLPEEVLKLLREKAKVMEFPKLTAEDKAQIEAEDIKEPVEYVDRGGQLGYKDPDTGEVTYS